MYLKGIALLFICLFVYSCQSNLNNKTENQLIVALDIKISKDDVLEVFYDDRETKKFNTDNSVRIKVNGTDEFQKFFFILPKDAFPNRIRIDIGQNRNQSPITIKKIGLRYNEASYYFSSDEIKRLFKPNIFTDFDFNTLIAQTKIVSSRYDPYLESFNLSKYINELILY